MPFCSALRSCFFIFTVLTVVGTDPHEEHIQDLSNQKEKSELSVKVFANTYMENPTVYWNLVLITVETKGWMGRACWKN